MCILKDHFEKKGKKIVIDKESVSNEKTIVFELTSQSEHLDFVNDISESRELADRAFVSAQAFREIVYRIRNQKKADILPVFDQLTAIAAVSCEIFLKCLLYHELPAGSHEKVQGHGLFDLYNGLNSSKEKIIKQMEDIYDQQKLEEEIRRHNHDFIDLRYTYELKSVYSDLGFLCSFMDALSLVCDRVLSEEQY